MRNARFWQWVNDGWVKLTLRPGQSFCHVISMATDEGYHGEATQWTYDDENPGVLCSETTWGRDCDGRHETQWDGCCPLDDLTAVETDDGTCVPKFERLSSSQYDQFAELMGY